MSGKIAILLAILVTLPLFAQPQDVQDTDSDSAERNARLAERLVLYTADDLIPKKLVIIVTEDFDIFLREQGFRGMLEFKPAANIRFMPRLIFSGTIADPQLSSPAYTNVGIGPRNSLNIDLVTGKYYWEW